MGLHLQLYQKAPGRQECYSSRSQGRHNGSRLYVCLCSPTNSNLSQVSLKAEDAAEFLTSFRRKVAAIGGMSAQIPIKGDEKANEVAMNKVRADKLREVTNGHDGTWIAHPLINKIAREIFDQHMLGSNQVRFRLRALLHTELSLLFLVPCPARGRSCRCC